MWAEWWTGMGMGTSCQRWTIFSAWGGRCFAALPKIWCKQAWYILVQLLLEPHYLVWTECWYVCQGWQCQPRGDLQCARSAISVFWNTWDQHLFSKMGVSANGVVKWPVWRSGKMTMKPAGFIVPIPKFPKATGFCEFGLFAQELLAVLQQLSDPADTRGGKVGFEPASGVPPVRLSHLVFWESTASLTRKWN